MNPVAAYQTSRVNGASPARLVVMLYDRMLGTIEEGRIALGEGRVMDAQLPLLKAQRIAAELLTALDPQGGEIAENLRNLYLYVLSTIEKAKTTGDAALLEGPARVLEPLRSAWREVAGAAEVEPAAVAAAGAPSSRPVLTVGMAG